MSTDYLEELERLHALRERGALSNEEFEQAKAKILRSREARAASAPGAVPPPTVLAVSQPANAFSSGHVLAQWVMGALALAAIIDIVAVFSGIAEVQLISRGINGEGVTLGEGSSNDNRQAVIGALQFVVFIVTAVLFLVWIHRAHRNLPALNASGLSYSPGWAVGGWFIPIMALWRPYQVTAEIWKASDPNELDPEGRAWQTAPVSPLLNFWWALWIISGIIGWVTLRSAFTEIEDLETLRVQSLVSVAADAIGVVTAVLAAFVVGHIDGRQEEKNYSRLASTGEATSPGPPEAGGKDG